jgi:hypothetical protein
MKAIPVRGCSLGHLVLLLKFFVALSKGPAINYPTVTWLEWTNLVAYGALTVGVLYLIWSLVRGSVSVLGLAFVIAGLLLELLVWFIR